ncbi:RAF-like serine/threonine-protein kinase PRAF [Curcuma longa]|uniref:RAF-like serine/threonine-protein kinase PRAF n=1 Tax=Curcuma longa TaxID=136217 RepID=UPI003D9E9E21
MASSDHRDLLLLRTTDAAAAGSDHPSTSAGDRRVKLRYSYSGKILPRLSDGALRYVGGETRILTVRRDVSLPEILRKMVEVYGGSVALRYQLPDEDLDALISVSTEEDLENMMEEYDKLAAEDPNAKLRVFLFSPSEVGTDPLAPCHDLQDTGSRYLEAINGLDLSFRRRDSVASLSSTQNSDGIAVAEAVGNEGTANEGMLPFLLTTPVASDESKSIFVGQDVPDLLMTTISSGQTQFLIPIQLEVPPTAPNQNLFINTIQAELPSASPAVAQSYIAAQNAQMMNPQPFLAMGVPRQINVVGPPHAYMMPSQTNTTTTHVGNGLMRVESQMDPNAGKILRIPGDAKLQPLSQLPPLPPPHFITTNVERRQVPPSSQGLSVKFEGCYLCQRALPHVHSDTLLSEQGDDQKHASPEANTLLQSYHSEDLSKRLPLQTAGMLLPTDNAVETQPNNLVAAALPGNHQFAETIWATPLINARPVVNPANLDHTKISMPPASGDLPGVSQVLHGPVGNPEKSHQEESVQNQSEAPVNTDRYNIVQTSGSLVTPHNLYATFVTQSLGSQQMQLPQQIGYHNYPLNLGITNRSFVVDANLVGSTEVQEAVQLTDRTVPTFLHGHVRPMDGMLQPLNANPAGVHSFNNHARSVVVADIGTSKDSRVEQPPFVMLNSHNTRIPDGESGLSNSNPLIASAVVPAGNSSLLPNQLTSMLRNIAYEHSSQVVNAIHTPNIIGNYGPYSYHHETAAGPRGMYNYVDPTHNNYTSNGNVSDRKNIEAPSARLVEVFDGGPILQNDSAQLHLNMDQLHRAVSSDPLTSNTVPVKLLDSTILLPRPSNISAATEDLYNINYPAKSSDFEIPIPASVSGHLPNSSKTDVPTELPHQLKGDACIKQDIQINEGRARATASAPTLQSCEILVPILSSHETEETGHHSLKECTAIDDEVAMDGKAETRNGQSDKPKIRFPNIEVIEHIQLIKNSDLEELQELGSGSFGTVYHGKWRGTDVAIKRINDRIFSGNSSEQDRAWTDFLNEACKLASLHHPNVVAFYGIVLDGPEGSIATVTEFMVNGSLRHALQKNEKMFDKRRRLLIAMDVAFGMEYLHSKSIIHFDLKSDNFLVNLRDPQRPICKVADLGLSKLKYETLMSGGMRGTLPWMAPELLGGKENKYSEMVDVFSFGIVMWELITGDEPYRDMHYGAIIGGIVSDTLRPPVPESCDPEWRSLMEQCWATEPSQRPSFTEIASRLRAMAISLPQKGDRS